LQQVRFTGNDHGILFHSVDIGMQKTKIIQSIKSIVPLSKSAEDAFAEILICKTIKKKEFLLKEGEVCNKVTYLNSGCTRLFFNVNGIENTVQFFFSDSFYTDYASFLTNEPSRENLQALEPCEIIQIAKDDLYQLYNHFPEFDRVGRLMAEQAFISIHKLNSMLKNEEPELRYLNLLKQRPELMKKIPQHYIASYLGIQPESLSRIKKRIVREK
jgi:CRP/FNR family transcriptional regulator, anaerobic regulatory protein